MGKLIYSISSSLDGFVADEKRDFTFTQPSEDVHSCINSLLKNVGTFLLGRQMYETLAVWDTIPTNGPSQAMNEFACIWNVANKIVYSRSLMEVSTANTTIEQVFDPEIVQKSIAQADRDFGIGGPQQFENGTVHLQYQPVRAV